MLVVMMISGAGVVALSIGLVIGIGIVELQKLQNQDADQQRQIDDLKRKLEDLEQKR
jgi:uncharacterized membrane-anchored protein YhcB (DUF1043 family)